MINEYKKEDIAQILKVINDSALKYKGVIPDDCWHEPYMSEKELLNEFNRDFCIYGFKNKNVLIGVMGMERLAEVTLIRHAYILSSHQRMGIGKYLLNYILKRNKKTTLYVGTWKDASWAIQFYKKFGFAMHKSKDNTKLLKKYWEVPLKQIKNSVVLEKSLI